MTTPAPPLTEAELDSMANMRSSLWPFSWASRVIAQARRALALESELAQLRREKAERDLDRLAIEASIVAEDTRRELEALRAFEQYFRATKHYVRHGGPFPVGNMNELLKAVEEARK